MLVSSLLEDDRRHWYGSIAQACRAGRALTREVESLIAFTMARGHDRVPEDCLGRSLEALEAVPCLDYRMCHHRKG